MLYTFTTLELYYKIKPTTFYCYNASVVEIFLFLKRAMLFVAL
jgi:hypothetical protein